MFDRFSELPLSDLSPTRESRGVLPGSPYQLCLSQEGGGRQTPSVPEPSNTQSQWGEGEGGEGEGEGGSEWRWGVFLWGECSGAHGEKYQVSLGALAPPTGPWGALQGDV